MYTDTFELQFYFVEKKNDFNFCLIIYIIFNGRPRQYFLLFVHFIFYFFQSCMLVPLDLNACSVLFLSHFKFIILISVSSYFFLLKIQIILFLIYFKSLAYCPIPWKILEIWILKINGQQFSQRQINIKSWIVKNVWLFF